MVWQYIHLHFCVCLYTHKDTQETNLPMDEEDAGGNTGSFSNAWTMDGASQGTWELPLVRAPCIKEMYIMVPWTALIQTTTAFCSRLTCLGIKITNVAATHVSSWLAPTGQVLEELGSNAAFLPRFVFSPPYAQQVQLDFDDASSLPPLEKDELPKFAILCKYPGFTKG